MIAYFRPFDFDRFIYKGIILYDVYVANEDLL